MLLKKAQNGQVAIYHARRCSLPSRAADRRQHEVSSCQRSNRIGRGPVRVKKGRAVTPPRFPGQANAGGLCQRLPVHHTAGIPQEQGQPADKALRKRRYSHGRAHRRMGHGSREVC